MWTPERVWESSLTSDVAVAGINYTVLDDYHFRAAGLTDQQLTGYYLTEDGWASAARPSQALKNCVTPSRLRRSPTRSTIAVSLRTRIPAQY